MKVKINKTLFYIIIFKVKKSRKENCLGSKTMEKK